MHPRSSSVASGWTLLGGVRIGSGLTPPPSGRMSKSAFRAGRRSPRCPCSKSRVARSESPSIARAGGGGGFGQDNRLVPPLKKGEGGLAVDESHVDERVETGAGGDERAVTDPLRVLSAGVGEVLPQPMDMRDIGSRQAWPGVAARAQSLEKLAWLAARSLRRAGVIWAS